MTEKRFIDAFIASEYELQTNLYIICFHGFSLSIDDKLVVGTDRTYAVSLSTLPAIHDHDTVEMCWS